MAAGFLAEIFSVEVFLAEVDLFDFLKSTGRLAEVFAWSGVEDNSDCGSAKAALSKTQRIPQTNLVVNTRNLKPDRTAFFLFCADTLLPQPSLQLMTEIGTHDGNVIFGQAAQQLMLEIVNAGCCRAAIPLLKRPPALVDIFL